MMKKTAILTILLMVPAIVSAQQLTDLKDRPFSNKSSFSLFNPSRLKMSQSYSFGYYSGRGGSGTVGYYLNSIEYTFSNPLKVRFDLGFLHNPSNMFSRNSSISNSSAFVPAFSLDWRPAKYFHFRLDYRQVPVNNYGGHGYFGPDYWEDYR